ncbi:MAG: DUF4097 family beta strand repeat protein [Lachnospiraceae bacterium]|nr:DUF4097 family beta strand repeat protein [Lachnospiraceae bacterium]MBQ6095461.1 DUF4097 family beta strand repeat protein [Lachnospiraceae bacterium]
MKDKIKSVITELFENAPDTQEVIDLKEEMISNAEEKYEDLIQRGFTEEQAYTMVMGSIGDIQELLAELGIEAGEAKDEKEDDTSDYWEKQGEYWEKQCEYWKWQGENFEKYAKDLGEHAKNFGQQFEKSATDFGEQTKQALTAFIASDVFETIATSIKQIISDIGINTQTDDGKYTDMQVYNERKFAADGITEIVMELAGSPVDVDVQLTTDPEILVQEFYNKDPQEKQLLEYALNGKQLKIQYSSNVIGFPRRGTVRVFLPENLAGTLEEMKIITASADVSLEDIGASKLVVRTVSGDVAGACAIGDVSITTVSGDVAFESIEGDAVIRTASGDIKVDKITGKANVNSASGDLKVKDLKGNGVFRSASGDVLCNLTQAGEKLEVSTASGDVELSLPAEVSVQMTLKTASGDIKTFCDCIATDENVNYVKSGKRAVGTIGAEPYLQLKVSTASGDIEVNR